MYYDREQGRVVLSVRELCALALSGGSLDSRRPPRNRFDAAQKGTAVHDRLRQIYTETALAATTTYHPELPLCHVARCEDVTFSVSGRADGVWYDPAGDCMVEEIKTAWDGLATRDDIAPRQPRTADLAQLTCYGYFLAAAKGLSRVTLRLTYARPGAEVEAVHMDTVQTVEQLRAAYIALLRMILSRARDMVWRETHIRDTARDAVFPYVHMRDAQKDMILECWRDMRAGKTLFAQAPTGIGKTIATLYPAVRCLGEDRCDRIFYLTAKNATRREAFGAMTKLIEAGTPLRACVITARESACLCDAARSAAKEGRRLTSFCNPENCPYARGYYDRVEPVIEELLAGGNGLFSGLTIRDAARRHTVCPYELALDLSERCEVIICDYNYAFSPAVSLRRYFADGIPGSRGHRYLFLVDEAHNLPDRARDMYSGQLELSRVLSVQDTLHAWETQAGAGIFPVEDWGEPEDRNTPRLTSASLDDLIGVLSRFGERCRESMVTGGDGVRRGAHLDRECPVELTEIVRKLAALCDRWIRRNPTHPMVATVDELLSALRAFRTAADYYDDAYVTFTRVVGNEVSVRLDCLDPAAILRPILHRAVARVLFSATLTPADYFADILGGDGDSVLVSFESPFPTDHLCVALCDKISTRYEDRETSYRRVVSYIAATVSAKPGNYMVYFPSYAYLDQVYARFHKKYPQVKTVVQTPGMTHAQREAFIAAFTPDGKEIQIGFCVLGGSFSEGVDLPGRCLIGALIVGVGIPGLSDQRNMMRDYYDRRLQAGGEEVNARAGYDYAYTYPGMNHVLQAAGRVIRRPEDRGVVVLLDDRYMADPYLHLYPAHWERMSAVGDAGSLYEYLTHFWEDGEGGK